MECLVIALNETRCVVLRPMYILTSRFKLSLHSLRMWFRSLTAPRAESMPTKHTLRLCMVHVCKHAYAHKQVPYIHVYTCTLDTLECAGIAGLSGAIKNSDGTYSICRGLPM